MIENRWEVNLAAYKGWEFPKLDKLTNSVHLVNDAIWRECQHGTVIKLENVDLRGNGEQKMEGLRRVFADFYLLDSLKSTIYVAVKTTTKSNVEFEPVEKKIAYKNFYALFDNSGLNIASKMNNSIRFTWASPYDHIANVPRETQFLEEAKYQTYGKFIYELEDKTKVEKEYLLTGWIGIHATIEPKHAIDDNFMRNKVYQPNRLRLYVRNNLAVSDYFALSPNTHEIANYIEGEISFDVLDDDELPDIATSSRQDFLDDQRIKILINIVEPIIAKLFSLRIKIGREISEENEAYKRHLLEIEKAKRKAEEEARAKAEEEARKARQDKIKAEAKYEEAKSETKKYQSQNNTIFSALSEDQKSFSAKTHLIKTNALTIRNGIKTLAKKIGIDNYKELGAIAVATDKILSAIKYSALAKFDIENEYIVEDLFVFCEEYLLNVLSKQYFNIDITTNIQGTYRLRFNPQHISLLLDNLVANSEKSNSTELIFDMIHESSVKQIIISDNGNGFGKLDKEQIFEFGFSNTGGTGIGLYNVKTVVKKIRGEIKAEKREPKGARFIITLP